ncbi:MAG TPA: response regulator [Thermoanaerobaculia bacterium]|nr:response regulator [Thermoanaerobaculia bacterium]
MVDTPRRPDGHHEESATAEREALAPSRTTTADSGDGAAVRRPAQEEKVTPEPPLVLVVDDYAEGREICAEYLTLRGYRVDTAADGVEALAKVEGVVPDAIIMDLSLPRMDGWEATRRLRKDDRMRNTPIIALTAHAVPAARESALEAGCDAVVIKPCVPRDLEEEVRRHLERRRTSPPGDC